MRTRIRIVGLLVALLFSSSGCMVLDEVDAANAKMTKGKKTTAPTAAAAPAAPADKTTVLQQSTKWWKKATSLAPASMDSSIVRCQIDGGTQYMSRDDCLSRGGRAANASG